MSHSTTGAEHTKNDKSINFSAEFNTKVDRTLSDTPYFGSVWRLLVKWGTGNRALSVLAVIPFFRWPHGASAGRQKTPHDST